MSARMAENRLTVFCVEEVGMLTDVALKNLKPREKAYKDTDRDGLYVQVSTSGTLTFRLDYRLHGRRETLTLGKYGHSGLSLRSEEQQSELQSLLRISYAVFCLKKQ